MNSDPDFIHPLPLSLPWERAAVKEISEILDHLGHGRFESPYDFANRLRQTADAIDHPLIELQVDPWGVPEEN